MIHLHHAISLALIYTNRATYGKTTMITADEAQNYQDVINNNLKIMKSKVNDLMPPDYVVNLDDLFFTYETDIDNFGYYILKNDARSLELRKRYIINMPLDIILASQKPNALRNINLEMIDGKIIKNSHFKIKKLSK